MKSSKQEALKKIEELKKFVEQCDQEKRDTPKMGEDYWLVDDSGRIATSVWSDDRWDKDRLKMGNCFWGDDAEKAAEMHKLRLQAYAERYIPEEGEDVSWWNFRDKEAMRCFNWDYDDLSSVFHKTKEDCEAWGKKYQEAFEYLYKK